MVRISPSGRITYGYSVVCVDGAIPTPLVGRTVGQPAWQSNTQLIYQDGNIGGVGPWELHRITYPALTVDVISPRGANTTYGGGGIWAAWLGSDGFARTSDPDLGPWPGASLADVSAEGRVVRIDVYQGGGLTVFDANGNVLFAQPNLVLGLNYICRLRGNLLSYLDNTGHWHIVDILTGGEVPWLPRLDAVNWMIPVQHHGLLYIMERTDKLTLREATRQDAWVLRDVPDTYNPDARSVGGLIRVASCNVIGELPDSLMVFDVVPNTATGKVDMTFGTIVGGAIVYQLPQTIDAVTVSVGEFSEVSIVKPVDLPYRQPFIATDGDAKTKGLISREWQIALQRLEASVQNVARQVQSTPVPMPVPPGSGAGSGTTGFTTIQSPGQPDIMASPGAQTLVVQSDDSSVQIALTPGPQLINLRAAGGGGGGGGSGCCEPLTNGDPEVCELIFADGDVIMVDPPTGP